MPLAHIGTQIPHMSPSYAMTLERHGQLWNLLPFLQPNRSSWRNSAKEGVFPSGHHLRTGFVPAPVPSNASDTRPGMAAKPSACAGRTAPRCEPSTPVPPYSTNDTNHEGFGCGPCHLASLDSIPRISAPKPASGVGSPMGSQGPSTSANFRMASTSTPFASHRSFSTASRATRRPCTI